MRLTNADIKRLGIVIDGDRGHIDRKQKPKPVTVKVPVVQWDAKIIPGGVWIQIPFPPPSLNVWKNWHWSKQAEFKTELAEAIRLLAIERRLPQFHQARIEITHYFKTKRRRDTDNYCQKFIGDALVRAGILNDDNTELVEVPEPVLKVDKERPRTEIFVYEK